jgi:hypothetical protein
MTTAAAAETRHQRRLSDKRWAGQRIDAVEPDARPGLARLNWDVNTRNCWPPTPTSTPTAHERRAPTASSSRPA